MRRWKTLPMRCAGSSPSAAWVAARAPLIEATAGEPAAFLVTPKDSFGNSRLLDVEDAFSVALARRRPGGASLER